MFKIKGVTEMTMTKRMLGAACAAILAGAILAAPAAAQQKAPVILVVNQAQVLAQSKAGASINSQLEKMQQAANAELNAQAEAIVKEGEDLKKQRELMAENVWMEKAKALTVKQNNLPAVREVKVRELQISEQQAFGKLNTSLEPILKKIVESRGATLLVDRAAVIFAAADTDITAQVISELDKAVTNIAVQKVSLAELQKQAQAAQAAQQGKAAAPKKK